MTIKSAGLPTSQEQGLKNNSKLMIIKKIVVVYSENHNIRRNTVPV